MAKINLNNQQNQENPSVVVTLASVGVLLCMVVTVLGIKLWWFKHRLSFDQTTTQNGAAGGNPPTVVIPRRNKKQKFKDKRWSQQIYENVEVHGVFRQKTEDDMEIQRPLQLPPVRIRQLSGSTQSLILPPPRNKRGQANSTAFEDMEIGTPITLTPTASTIAVNNINESDTKLSLTFEEFEKQFKLKEIKPEVTEISTTKTEEVIEIPVPPLRLNRSSSAMQNPEKTTRFLKSSQSMAAVPEFHRVKERRQTGVFRPTEDLSRIDDYEEIKVFENFGERRPTGYIKYEEVDRDLTEQYEKELNQGNYFDDDDDIFTENNNWKSSKDFKDIKALESLRNERIVYQNDLNESPEVINLEKDRYSEANQTRSIQAEDLMKREYIETFEDLEFKHRNENPQASENLGVSVEYEDYLSTKQRRPTGYVKNEDILSKELEEEMAFKSIKDRRPTEFVRDLPADLRNELSENMDSLSITDEFDNQFSNWPQFEEKIETPKVNVRKFENHDFETQTSLEETEGLRNKSEKPVNTFIDKENMEKSFINQRLQTDFERISLTYHDESADLSENEYLEKSSTTQKLLYSQVRSLMTEETKELPDKTAVTFKITETLNSDYEDNEISALKQRRPTGFVNIDKEEEYNQERQVKFDMDSDYDQVGNENSSIKQRRPTGFVSKSSEREEDMERSVNFNIAKDQEYENDIQSSIRNQRRPTGYNKRDMEDVVKDELPQPKVTFKNSKSFEEDYENYSLNQRRPTGFIRNLQTQPDSDDYEDIVINDLPETKVQFSDNIPDTQRDTEIWLGKQRRPTGYIKKTEMEEFSNDTSELKVTFNESTLNKEPEYDSENSLVKQRRPTGYVIKSEREHELNDFKELENNLENSLPKQKRPTSFTKELYREDMQIQEISNDKEILKTSSVRFQDIEPTNKDSKHLNDFLIKQRASTGFVTTPDIEKLFDTSRQVNFNLNNLPQHQDENYEENIALKTRRPTGYVRNYDYENRETLDQQPLGPAWLYKNIKSAEIVDPLWQEMEKDLEHDFTQNVDEEFSKIRHSYELNEADFLELKNELSTTVNTTKKDLGFGKTIEDDWENFEKLETSTTLKLKGEEQTEIQITYNEDELNTTSILKETKVVKEQLDTIEVEEIKAKPRKSKVTFDFKTEEHLIPARSAHLDSEEDEYYEDTSDYDGDDTEDIYDRPPPSMPPPPQPKQRLSNMKYNSELPTSSSSAAIITPVVSIPTSISLFGSQVSQEDSAEEDSWSAIRKHRNLTEEFQHISLDSSAPSSPSPPVYQTTPPKPAYRNPLAQLAIQRAKEVRTEMGDFKARSINDARKPPQASKRNQQKVVNLPDDDFHDTEA